MSNNTNADGTQTRYGHTNRSGGNQDQGERKDEDWESRQGGRQSHDPGVRGRERGNDAADRPRSGREARRHEYPG